MERRLGLGERDGEVARGDHGLQQFAHDALQALEGRAGQRVVIGRQVGQRVALGEGHQRPGQLQQALVQALGVQLRMVAVVQQARAGGAGGMQQPERGDVARAELDDVLVRLAVRTVQRIDLGLQHVQQAAQQRLQRRRGLQRHRGRHVARIQLEAAGGGAAHAAHRHRHQVVARHVVGQQAHAALEQRDLGLRGLRVLVFGGHGHAAVVQRAIVGLRLQRGVAALGAQLRDGGMEDQLGVLLGPVGQVQRRRQRVFAGGGVELAVGEDQRKLVQPQHAAVQALGIDAYATHAPGIGMQRACRLGQPPLVIRILALEMLGPQEQAFAPQDLGTRDQGGFLFIGSGARAMRGVRRGGASAGQEQRAPASRSISGAARSGVPVDTLMAQACSPSVMPEASACLASNTKRQRPSAGARNSATTAR